jgi:serine/threonine protein phosphatase PrpC
MDITKVAWTVAGRRLTAAAGSVTGERYRDNYDVVELDPGRPLAVLADGMGDGPGSAAAGRTAVDAFRREAPATCSPGSLRAAVAMAQQEVRRAARTLDELTGCTLTAFVAGPDAVPPPPPDPGSPAGVATPAPGAWLVQIGDSRAYRLRGGLLELLTVDHTIAWVGLLHGWFAHDSAEAHAARYRLTRYVGHPEEPEPDVVSVTLHPGDLYLLCTDGVADQLSYERVTRVLATVADPAEVVHTLLAATLTAGGADNATAVVIRVEQTV